MFLNRSSSSSSSNILLIESGKNFTGFKVFLIVDSLAPRYDFVLLANRYYSKTDPCSFNAALLKTF
jgi:hypothetical protein